MASRAELIRAGSEMLRVDGLDAKRARAAASMNLLDQSIPFADRFWHRVDKSSDCWIWLGRTSLRGYGRVNLGRRQVMAHRVAFEFARGPIPEGMTLDHLCFRKSCVNPGHMEVVSRGENARRFTSLITHCPKGHPFDDENTFRPPDGSRRSCRACRQANERKRKR